MRRWVPALLAVLVVLDVGVLGLGLRTREGVMPPLQKRSAEFTPAPASSSPSARPGADSGIHGPLLLGANESGLVLRATRGACETRFNDPAKVWVGSLDDGTDLDDVDLPGLHEVLGLFVADTGSMVLSGLDQDCQPTAFESKDEGATWQETTVADVWRLDSDTSAFSVTGPAGKASDVTCAPVQMVNLPGRRAVASCDSSTFYVLQAGKRPVPKAAAPYTNLSVTPAPTEEHYYAFGTTVGCVAQVAEVGVDDDPTETLACLGADRAPLAIATSGDRVVVQVGDDLMVSSDEGKTFTPVAPDETTSS